MEFLTLDDEDGIFEVTVFPNAYRRLRGKVSGLDPYIVTGRAEDQYGARTVSVLEVRLA